MPENPADPRYTIIVAGDDGEFYKVIKKDWMKEDNRLTAVEKGVVQQLTTFGSYLAYIPPDMLVGIGSICTVVNLKSILKNNQ